jgi:hypothetical protein
VTQSIRKLVTAAVDQNKGLPPDKVAWAAVKQVDPKDWRNVLVPLVLDAVREVRRERARAAEQVFDSMPAAGDRPADSPVEGEARAATSSSPSSSPSRRFVHVTNRSLTSWLVEMSDYLETTFQTDDGTEVSWKEATADQHQARIDMLSVLRDGVSHTIDRHRRARDNIVANGVERLADLMPEAKAS